MAETLLKVEGLGKKYCKDLRRSLHYGLSDLCRELVGKSTDSELRKKEFWALKNISLTLKRGECLGIIGRNGAGKSTLLKIISGLVKPTIGRVSVHGNMQALIELGAGFHPMLTGRENILINASVLGIQRKYIEEKLDEIIDFSEIGDFIDAPIQSYSSGMKVRLGFAVALHMNPDIILIDEVLAVGDARFRRKAQLAMNQFLAKDKAVLFVSHNMHHVLSITDRVIWLDSGCVRLEGETSKVASAYLQDSVQHLEEADSKNQTFIRSNEAKITGELRVKSAFIDCEDNPEGRSITIEPNQTRLRLIIDFECEKNLEEHFNHTWYLATTAGDSVACSVIRDAVCVKKGDVLRREMIVEMPPLHPGSFVLNYSAIQDGAMMFDSIEKIFSINIAPYSKENTEFGMQYDRMTQGAIDGFGVVQMQIKYPDE
ncbi:MAG: ABC transporter ATP-binding protein [Euryarchaeota archaeon]|nr:ABC transporter ATP-binding protein [Euryarchaeota archaeon]|tara:strand:+ start:3420 stop:4706 length:1287 start_codon:yes stop_codon:yes gene_type:complete